MIPVVPYNYEEDKRKHPLPKCSLCDNNAPVLTGGVLLCASHYIEQDKRRKVS
jgi:hypothetical protein